MKTDTLSIFTLAFRYRHLIRKIDLDTDPKLNYHRVEVRVERLSAAVAAELKTYGEVYVKEFPELLSRLGHSRKRKRTANGDDDSAVSFDAEIDRLCDLASVEKKRSDRGAGETTDSEDDGSQSTAGRKKKKRIKSEGLNTRDPASSAGNASDVTDGLSDEGETKGTKEEQQLPLPVRETTTVMVREQCIIVAAIDCSKLTRLLIPAAPTAVTLVQPLRDRSDKDAKISNLNNKTAPLSDASVTILVLTRNILFTGHAQNPQRPRPRGRARRQLL